LNGSTGVRHGIRYAAYHVAGQRLTLYLWRRRRLNPLPSDVAVEQNFEMEG
jgi:hypothetical protein